METDPSNLLGRSGGVSFLIYLPTTPSLMAFCPFLDIMFKKLNKNYENKIIQRLLEVNQPYQP